MHQFIRLLYVCTIRFFALPSQCISIRKILSLTNKMQLTPCLQILLMPLSLFKSGLNAKQSILLMVFFFNQTFVFQSRELYFLNKPRKLLCIKLEKFALDSDRNHNENDLSQVLKGAGGLLASFFQIRWQTLSRFNSISYTLVLNQSRQHENFSKFTIKCK